MKKTKTIYRLAFGVWLALLFYSCARMGQPDGGWYDEKPPRVVSASPEDRGVNVRSKKVYINFDEYIKVESATEKVVISPPQLEQAEIRAAGKSIVVELKDTLKDDMTYTIDFSDAISDNNEGNPMGNYTYSFSTGPQIDTLEVSGTVLSAEELEPVKGTLVGLYRAEDFEGQGDSTMMNPFKDKPLMRVSRTDSRGHFIIRGVAPGRYRVFALDDSDNNFRYTQASEAVAFNHDIVIPSCKPDTRQDTIWADSLHIKDIVTVPYTHFLPDNIVLRLFTKEQKDRYFLKKERTEPDHFTLFFTGPSKFLPEVRGLNFDSKDAFVIEPSQKNDTVTYWLRDTTLVNQDTLLVELTFEASDSAGVLVMQKDTTEILPKVSYAKRMKNLEKDKEKWYKDLEKRRKKSEKEITDTIYPVEPLKPRYTIANSMSPMGKVLIDLPAPLAKLDTAGIHLYMKKGEEWFNVPLELRRRQEESANDRMLEVVAEWRVGEEYSFEVDSATFVDIYGNVADKHKAGLKIKTLEEYSSLFVNVSGYDAGTPVLMLIDKSGKEMGKAVAKDGLAEFYYVNPGEYYMRAFVDMNGNGKWDTGDYDADRQPEDVYYYGEKIECRAKWDVTRNWNLRAVPVERQKPAEMVKQKADKQKTIRQRNAQRAKDKGIPLPKELQ